MDIQEFNTLQALLVGAGLEILDARFDQSSFGSWFVTVGTEPRLRAVWDGKEGWVVVQKQTSARDSSWHDIWIGRDHDEQNAQRVAETIRAAHSAA